MAVWKVICATPDGPGCPVIGGIKAFGLDETAARAEYALHAGHGKRSIHYCADALKNRWDDATDPRAQFEEGV